MCVFFFFFFPFLGAVEYIHVSLLVKFSIYVCRSFAMCPDELNDMDSDRGHVGLYFSFIALFAVRFSVSSIVL